MSLILSLETATRVCSVALHQDGELLAEKSVSENYSHFEKLPGLIDGIFREVNHKISELKAVSVSAGPGSYTGLRIGASMAKGIAFTLNIPLISVNTLKSLALAAKSKFPGDVLLCPMIDARRSEVYLMIVNHSLEEIWPVQALIVNVDSFNELTIENTIGLFGDGSRKFKSMFESNQKIIFEEIYPSAIQTGELAWPKFNNKEFQDTAYFEPFYLKDFMPGKSKKKLTL